MLPPLRPGKVLLEDPGPLFQGTGDDGELPETSAGIELALGEPPGTPEEKLGELPQPPPELPLEPPK